MLPSISKDSIIFKKNLFQEPWEENIAKIWKKEENLNKHLQKYSVN